MSEFHDSTCILNWLASFRIFHGCTIIVYSICHAGSVMDFQHCNLGKLVWCTQVQTESQGFSILQYFLEKLSKLWSGNSCFPFCKKSQGFFFFFCILFSQQFKVWLKHSQDMYLIFVFLFSRGMQLLLVKRYYNLSIIGEKPQLDLSKLPMS